MAFRNLPARIRSNQVIILFVILVAFMMLLAWWVADRLIRHIDQQVPGF